MGVLSPLSSICLEGLVIVVMMTKNRRLSTQPSGNTNKSNETESDIREYLLGACKFLDFLGIFSKEIFKFFFVFIPDNPLIDFTIFENQKKRNTFDLVFSSCILMLLHIYLGKYKVIGHLLRQFFKHRSHHVARFTPWCPKIHHNRFF